MPKLNLQEKIKEFSSFSFDQFYRLKYKENSPQWIRNHLYKSRFLYIFHRDETLRQWALKLLEKFNPDFMALYLQGIDYTCHGFWRYMRPWEFGNVERLGYKDVSRKDIKYFGQIIEKYYAHIDKVVEELLNRLPEDWALMVISDHGFQRISEKHITDRGPLAARFLSGSHRPEGVVIVKGKGMKPGRVQEVSIFDITPTILHFFGLPVGCDMDGRALEEIFSDRGNIQYIDTYEEGLRGEDRAIRTEASEEIVERLRGLGYLD
jgi:predicted AlkP superfamily phosphohydrolase/phosphomutase